MPGLEAQMGSRVRELGILKPPPNPNVGPPAPPHRSAGTPSDIRPRQSRPGHTTTTPQGAPTDTQRPRLGRWGGGKYGQCMYPPLSSPHPYPSSLHCAAFAWMRGKVNACQQVLHGQPGEFSKTKREQRQNAVSIRIRFFQESKSLRVLQPRKQERKILVRTVR